MTALPHNQSFWIVPDRCMAGNYPGDKTEDSARVKLQPILDSGVDVFIDLTESGELKSYAYLLPEDVRHIQFPIPDVSVPSVRSEMTAMNSAVCASCTPPTSRVRRVRKSTAMSTTFEHEPNQPIHPDLSILR